MRGIGTRQYGGMEQLTEIEIPAKELGPDDVLVSIKASG